MTTHNGLPHLRACITRAAVLCLVLNGSAVAGQDHAGSTASTAFSAPAAGVLIACV